MRGVDPLVHQTRAAAGACSDLAAVAEGIGGCVACPELVQARHRTVPGQFPPQATLLLLGEAPGAQEDETGQPFVGRSGHLLDQLLNEAGGDRSRTSVLNTLKCRPPDNRPPRPAETARCRGWTERQLALAGPAVVVTLGLSATRWFLGPVTLGAVRGRVHDAAGYRVVPTYHPSAALRFGPQGEPRRLLREDLAFALSLVP
ncbi:MAG: phage polymerase-related protein [Frankiales bacterium]|nr:phage polymerase-related protein [Frankiales bacterium]